LLSSCRSRARPTKSRYQKVFLFFFFYYFRSIFSVRDIRAFRRRTVASQAKYAAATAVKRRPERDKCDALVLETADSREQTPPPWARFASNNVVESKVAIGLPYNYDYGVHYQTIIAVRSSQLDRTTITVRSPLIQAHKTSINDQRYGFQRSECFIHSWYLKSFICHCLLLLSGITPF